MNCTIQPWVKEKARFSQSERLADLLLSCRLVWYKQIMTERLLRFKHVIVILITLIVPTLSVLPKLIANPFLFIVLPRPTTFPVFVALVAAIVHATYVLWIALQKEAIVGGQAMTYLSSFPLSLSIRRKTDLKLLLIANNIFWLPIIASLILVIKSTSYTDFASFTPLFHWLLLVLSLSAAQWLYLHEQFSLLVFMCMGVSSILALALWIVNPWFSFFTSVMSILLMVRLLGYRKKSPSNRSTNASSLLKTQRLRFNWKFLSLIAIDYAILFRKYRQESYTRLFFCVLILVILYQVSTKSSIGIEQIYPIAFAVPNLIVSGWYSKLSLEHKYYRNYLSSLPFSSKSWVLLDISVICLITLSLQILFFTPFLISNQFTLSKFCGTLLAQIPLVAILYFCQTQLSKLCQVVGTATTGIWLSLFFMVG